MYEDEDTDYALHGTPSATEAEIVRGGDQPRLAEGRPEAQQGYLDPRAPSEQPVSVLEAVGMSIGEDQGNIISIHGYMHQQGKRSIIGPIQKKLEAAILWYGLIVILLALHLDVLIPFVLL